MKNYLKKRFTIEGLNLSRAVCELQNMGVEMFDITFCDVKRLTFTTYVKDCDKVVAYLEKKCYNITNIEKIGVLSSVAFLKTHLLSICMLFITIFVLCIIGTRCTDIIIYAPQDVCEEVEQTLKEMGVVKGISKKEISFDSIENAVCVATPTIKYAFASFSGSRLIIQVEMRAIADQPIDNVTPQDIVATSNGKITRILVVNGTPLVKVGDDVHVGQVLIKGETVFPDGTVTPVKAIGEVWATSTLSASVKFNPVTMQLLPTGNEITRHRLKIGNYYTEYSKTITYDYFTTYTTQARLFPIGIVVEYEKIYEMQLTEKITVLQDVLPDLQLQAYEQLKKLLKNKQYDQIVYGIVEQTPNDIFVTATTQIMQNIATGG